ncbi:hypothetical protein HanIR_Chr11g0534741 [Helianthus annuus]|nr:hypothetical protein HanIR_Chr11g0534741 [Helianthus annuus]
MNIAGLRLHIFIKGKEGNKEDVRFWAFNAALKEVSPNLFALETEHYQRLRGPFSTAVRLEMKMEKESVFGLGDQRVAQLYEFNGVAIGETKDEWEWLGFLVGLVKKLMINGQDRISTLIL